MSTTVNRLNRAWRPGAVAVLITWLVMSCTAVSQTHDASGETLSGSAWIVTAYEEGEHGVVGVVPGTELTAAFGADGQLRGHAGCNHYFAAYQLAGRRISIGPTGATRMFCAQPPGAMEQEALFLEALGSAATFRIQGDTLELRNTQDALEIRFSRSNASPPPR